MIGYKIHTIDYCIWLKLYQRLSLVRLWPQVTCRPDRNTDRKCKQEVNIVANFHHCSPLKALVGVSWLCLSGGAAYRRLAFCNEHKTGESIRRSYLTDWKWHNGSMTYHPMISLHWPGQRSVTYLARQQQDLWSWKPRCSLRKLLFMIWWNWKWEPFYT